MNKNKTLETLTSISKIKEWLAENKAFALFASALIVLLIIESFFHAKIVTLVEKRVLKVIEKESIPLVFKSLDYGYLPPRLVMSDVVYSGGKNIAEVEEVSISTKIIPLIKLKVVPSTLFLYKPDIRWSLNLNKDKKKESIELNFDKIMKSFPLYKVEIEKGNLYLENKDINLQLQSLDLTVTKSTRSIRAELASITELGYKDYYENFSVNFNANLDENSIYIKYLNLQKQNSILKVSGSVKTQEIFNKNRNLSSISAVYEQLNEISVNSKVSLNDFNSTLKLASNSKRNFSGELQATGYFNQNNEDQKSSVALTAQNIKVPKLNLLSAKIGASISTKNITFKDDTHFSFGPRSIIKLKSAHIEKNDSSYWTNFNFATDSLLLEDILNTFNVPSSSFNSPIKGESDCTGSLSPNLTLSCNGELDVEKFVLTLDQKTFADLNRMQSSFKANIGSEELSFSAKPFYKNENQESFTGLVSGNVHFKKGFSIDYKTDSFDLGFLNSIAGQNLSGVISAEGKTEGSANWGKFHVDVKKGENLNYNDFFLGQAKASISYSYPSLDIQEIEGTITNNDTYNADFSLNTDVDLMNLKIEGEGFSNDSVKKVFKNSFSFPEGVTFNNSEFKLSLVGEPDIEKVDLYLSSNYPNLNVFGERFKNSKINLKGQDGVWSFHDTFFKKKNSVLSVSGDVKGFKSINIALKSMDLKLESLDTLKEKKVGLKGPAVFRLDANGPIDGPKATGRIQLKSTVGLRGDTLGDSDLGFRIFENQINFKGDAFNQKVIGNGSYPLDEDGNLSFNGKVQNLDLLQIFNFMFDNSSVHYLPMTFSSDLVLSFKDKDTKISGWLDDVNFDFKSANENIFNVKNLETIRFTKDDAPLTLTTGENFKANIFVKTKNKSALEIKVDGKIEAHALQTFIPKTEILRGVVDVKDSTLIVSNKNFEHYGTVNFLNGTFKNESFPYSFTDINTELVFRKNKILFDELEARINNNPLKASGFLSTSPLSIETLVKYKNLQIEYPEGISSLSDGDLKISGDSLPLLAKGKIDVKKGEFKRDLLSGVDGKTITANKFLPQEILYKNAPPFNLNLILNIADNYSVKTSEINGRAFGELKLDGNAYNPITRGRIELKRGMTIGFLDKIFIVQEGRLGYSNNYIDSPDLYIDATTEVADNNDITSNKYLIRMLVEGSTENLKFSFNSTPSLSEKEIISLLTLGTVSTQSVGQEINTQQQATHSGLQVGSFLLQKNKGIQELQKKTGTEIGISSSVNAFNVNPKVQLKKKWSPKLSSTVSQSFGNQQVLELSTEYKVNQNVSTSFTIQNNQTQDATQLLNRQVQQGEIFGVDLQYKFEFD